MDQLGIRSMIVRQTMPLKWLFYYTWRSLLFLLVISSLAAGISKFLEKPSLIPVEAAAIFSAALSIYLGFRSNNAYDRWWEARSIWGLLVNYSRAFTRQVLTFIESPDGSVPEEEIEQVKLELIQRHIAFVHALRIFLRSAKSYPHEARRELVVARNDVDELRAFLSADEFEEVSHYQNIPNMLTLRQGITVANLASRGLLTDYRFIQLDQSLVEFANIQGRSERIKFTPLPRTFSFFQRVFVYMHTFIMAFTFAPIVGWWVILVTLIVNYIFITIDFVGSRTEDPFENRYDDVSLSAISTGIENTLREMIHDSYRAESVQPCQGVLL